MEDIIKRKRAVLKKRLPERVRIKYNIQKATAGSYGEWTMKILAKRCGVKPPQLFKHPGRRSFFAYPNRIYLSKHLYKSTMSDFVAVCLHEFAHYLNLGQMSKKEFELRANKHDGEFVKWLTVASRAGFCNPRGERYYPWEKEYVSVIKCAAKMGILKLEEKK
jgi:hypothetical protein